MRHSENVESYIEKADEYFNEGEEALKNNNFSQASEKYWGAASQVVKAYAETKGYPHDGHAQLFDVVRKLSKELEDKNIINLFHIANSLHINFYENWFAQEEVTAGAEQVKIFIEKIKLNLRQKGGANV